MVQYLRWGPLIGQLLLVQIHILYLMGFVFISEACPYSFAHISVVRTASLERSQSEQKFWFTIASGRSSSKTGEPFRRPFTQQWFHCISLHGGSFLQFIIFIDFPRLPYLRGIQFGKRFHTSIHLFSPQRTRRTQRNVYCCEAFNVYQ